MLGTLTELKCSRCKQEKDPSHFTKRTNRARGVYSQCKECRAKAQKQRNNNNRAIQAHRHAWTLKKFGLTPAQYEAMAKAQDYVCASCGDPETTVVSKADPRVRRLAVDHCHVTGKVRGLLCRACNQGIGNFKDEPWRMEAAATYIREAQNPKS